MVRSGTTRPLSCWRVCIAVVASVLLATFVAGGWSDVAHAQTGRLLSFPKRPKPIVPQARPATEKAPMLLQATEINYDYVNKRVSAVGSVQIYYSGSTLEADRVIYDETTKRMHAEGNVRLTDANGQITYGDLMNLSEDFRDGFVDSLRVETADQTRMAAARADRSSGDFTVFQSGVYTACEPCKDDPRKPPLWQIKASRIIHDTGEKMIYFENANVEFFGTPMAYFPYLSTPDPTVKRKSGFLYPVALYSSVYGAGIQVPYYWALAPDYDLTITPRLMSRQGLLMKGEWRQRLDSGYYTIALSGIYQLDKDYFLDKYHTTNYPSYRDFRGSLETRGRFAITDKWNWGWDGLVPTDSLYYSDYGLSSYQRNANFVLAGFTEGLNQVYITGRGNRSYFDARSIYYYGFSVADVQSQIPIIHPVVDYFYTVDQPVLGGELGFRTNLTSLSRNTVSFDPISQFANVTGVCAPASADPMAKIPANCLLRGIPGNYSRFSAEANWKRTYTDTIGQQWTPFASLRGDVMQMSIENQIGVSNYIAPGDRGEVRAMPAAGLEYRYPFINVQSWGTQTITPVAQIIVRPNETLIGKLPNEDSQSLIFDDSNLFKINKFSGWDRIEGGGRANVGLEYTAQFNRAGFVNMMFGQSYQLFGVNSFAVGDTTNTGLNSGLDTTRSDYVARLAYQPDKTYTFVTRYRFDQETWGLNRFEVEGRAVYDRISVSAMYGQYAPQPELGFLTWRQGILGTANLKLSQNWVATTALNYDIDARKFSSTQFGLGYIDDCFIFAMNYITAYSYSTVGLLQGGGTLPIIAPVLDHRVMLTIALRTIGATGTSQSLGSSGLFGSQ
jgi:LPS-assembly protein